MVSWFTWPGAPGMWGRRTCWSWASCPGGTGPGFSAMYSVFPFKSRLWLVYHSDGLANQGAGMKASRIRKSLSATCRQEPVRLEWSWRGTNQWGASLVVVKKRGWAKDWTNSNYVQKIESLQTVPIPVYTVPCPSSRDSVVNCFIWIILHIYPFRTEIYCSVIIFCF